MKQYWERGKLIWIAPGSVSYSLEEVELLLPWLAMMREGRYPPEPVSGYVGGARSGVSAHAPYETICQVAAELDRRLSFVGLDRSLVEDSYCGLLSDGDLARKYNMPEWQVRRHIRSAVTYISSGPCPRYLDCGECKRFTKCRKKKRHGVLYADWVGHRQRQWLTYKVSGMTP